MMSYERRRNLVQGVINRAPWDITIYRQGRTADDAETSFTLIGTIKPAPAQSIATGSMPGGMMGEDMSSLHRAVLLAPYDTATLKKNDYVLGEWEDVTRKFVILFARQTPWKWECILEERE